MVHEVSLDLLHELKVRIVELEAGNKGTFIRMEFVKQHYQSSAFMIHLYLLQALSALGSCNPFGLQGDSTSVSLFRSVTCLL